MDIRIFRTQLENTLTMKVTAVDSPLRSMTSLALGGWVDLQC